MILSEAEKNRIRSLHRESSVIKQPLNESTWPNINIIKLVLKHAYDTTKDIKYKDLITSKEVNKKSNYIKPPKPIRKTILDAFKMAGKGCDKDAELYGVEHPNFCIDIEDYLNGEEPSWLQGFMQLGRNI